MAKKPFQFRFEENYHKAILTISAETGKTVSEIMRDSVNLYIALYERSKNEKTRFYLKGENEKNYCEVILPWMRH